MYGFFSFYILFIFTAGLDYIELKISYRQEKKKTKMQNTILLRYVGALRVIKTNKKPKQNYTNTLCRKRGIN